MTTERIRQIDEQIKNTQRLVWNASQMRRGSVCRLQDELDQLYRERDRLAKAGG